MKSYRIKSLILNNLAGFWAVFLANGETVLTPTWVNDEFSGIGTCKFEFSTIKTYYKDIHNNILDKSQKKPPKWGVSSPKKVSREHEPEFCRGRPRC